MNIPEFIAFTLLLCVITNTSFAGVYHCKAEQSYAWIDAKLEQNPDLLEAFNIIRFTETKKGSVVLTNKRSEEDRGGGFSLRIVNKPDEKNDLVAIAISKSSLPNEDYVQTVMRIRGREKKAGLSFVLMGNAAPVFMVSGHCEIDESVVVPSQTER